MATVVMPSSVAARKMRIAISPRFAAINLRILRGVVVGVGVVASVDMGPTGEHTGRAFVERSVKIPRRMKHTACRPPAMARRGPGRSPAAGAPPLDVVLRDPGRSDALHDPREHEALR